MNSIALVSDIHGNLPALEAVFAHLKTHPVDVVVNLGDHLSGPLWPAETADLLMKTDWLHIRGNHDRNLVEQNPAQHNLSDRYTFQHLGQNVLAWLRKMPADLQVTDDMRAFHGIPGDDTVYLLEEIINGRTLLSSPERIRHLIGDGVKGVLLCGHTHKPRLVQLGEDVMIVNPGSVGLPAYEDDSMGYHISETGSPHARYALMEQIRGQWTVEMIALPYDYEAASRQAQKNNRPDWAVALRSGFVRGEISE